ncbi:uncharacterized protein LOC122163561 [Centrocercus urophasianus]|uniref:uncharacterized protein LOC122163561 n=1 Tax=Centrocercus urophasianus TaxID=9002 RepID=UPI001C6525C8|nr:uncharacterized protein LOC122163561 [Centrocercus urophasianus]
MSVLKVLFFILLVAGDSLSQEPNCTAIEDFGDCSGDSDGFCPAKVPCQCKNEKPFCRCDYYREGWMEYWYMGPKCNQLWNTLDLILVSVLPAVALVFLVVVIFQCVYCCKGKKAGKQTNSPYREVHHNPTFRHELSGNLGAAQQSPRVTWTGQLPKAVLRRQDFEDLPGPSHLDNSSPRYAQPLRRPDYVSSQQPQQFDSFVYPGSNRPYGGYAEDRQYSRY